MCAVIEKRRLESDRVMHRRKRVGRSCSSEHLFRDVFSSEVDALARGPRRRDAVEHGRLDVERPDRSDNDIVGRPFLVESFGDTSNRELG